MSPRGISPQPAKSSSSLAHSEPVPLFCWRHTATLADSGDGDGRSAATTAEAREDACGSSLHRVLHRSHLPDSVDVTRLLELQVLKNISGVFQKLHLSQIRAQRVSGGRDCRNRGVPRLLGCLPRVFGSMPKRLPLLSDGLQLLAILFTERPGLLGQDPELFRLVPRRLRHHAVIFGAATPLIRFLPKILVLPGSPWVAV